MNADHTPVLVIKAGPDDLQQLREISRKTFLETFADSNTAENMDHYLREKMSPEQLLQEMETPGSLFYFAFLGTALAGYLKVNTGSAQTEHFTGPVLEIERIYVLQQYKGTGIGRRLMDEAFRIAAGQGAEKVWLGVWEHNRKAIAFYEKLGFSAFDKHIFLLGTDEQTDILMEKAVPGAGNL